MTLATAGIVVGSYHRCGFGVLSGRPSTCWTTITLRCGVRRRRLDPVHPAVVADPVLHDQLALLISLGHLRAGLERVRVGVRVVQDRGHTHVPAADLAQHVGVLVLGADALITAVPLAASACAAASAAGGRQQQRGHRAGQDRGAPTAGKPAAGGCWVVMPMERNIV